MYTKTLSIATLLLLLSGFSPQANASVIASIICDEFGSGFICSASPADFENNTYTYFWSSTAPQPSPNSTCISGPTSQPFCYESCLEGGFRGTAVVEVTVVENATGDSDSASKALACGTGGGGGF